MRATVWSWPKAALRPTSLYVRNPHQSRHWRQSILRILTQNIRFKLLRGLAAQGLPRAAVIYMDKGNVARESLESKCQFLR
jgi:hypothetical protein